MEFRVRLQNSAREFPCDEGETLLDAADRAEVVLPYSCREGICGTCKGRVISGDVYQGPHAEGILSQQERDQGYLLLCCAVPAADCVLEVLGEEVAPDRPAVELRCTVSRLERLAPDVMGLRLALPTGEAFWFRPGQYLDLVAPDGTRRSFSMASAPGAGAIELHVRRVAGGAFTAHVFEAMREGDAITVEGPRGAFYLREGDRPIVLVAGGTGFAPMKSMLDVALASGLSRPTRLYWGGRRPRDLYMAALADEWARANAAFTFVPVVSEPRRDDAWSGRTGLVHEAVMADLPDLSSYDAYACGVPAMVEAARRDFIERCGLPADRFFADVFLTQQDRARPRAASAG
jgi:CDP-4-dehydro-6-deoxyglucose reductase